MTQINCELAQNESFEIVVADLSLPDPRHPLDAQFDVVVRGTSINGFAQDGDLLRCVDLARSEADVSDGDLVFLEFRGDDRVNHLVRRLRRVEDRVEFRCESDDPLWAADVLTRPGPSLEEDDGCRIVAKVLWKYRCASAPW